VSLRVDKLMRSFHFQGTTTFCHRQKSRIFKNTEPG